MGAIEEADTKQSDEGVKGVCENSVELCSDAWVHLLDGTTWGMWRGHHLARQDLNINKNGPKSHVLISWNKKGSRITFKKRVQCSPPLTRMHCELSSLPKHDLRTTGLLNTVLRGFAKTYGINLMNPALQSFPRTKYFLQSPSLKDRVSDSVFLSRSPELQGPEAYPEL